MEHVAAAISPELEGQVQAEQKQGKTVSYLATGKAAVGFVVISDKIKETRKEAIRKFQQEGLLVIMFTGDNDDTDRAVSETRNQDGYQAQVILENTLAEIKHVQVGTQKTAVEVEGLKAAQEYS